METFGDIIRKKRKEAGLTLKSVAGFLDIDQAILSKVERGKRRLPRDQVVKLAEYCNVNEEELLVAWLSDKLVYEVEGERLAKNALEAAEERIAYAAFKKIDRAKLMEQLINGIKQFPSIERAWIYGSFSRQDDSPKSDIDIAIKADLTFSYFDLAEVQFQLESRVNRKVDVGFIDSFKPYIFEHVKPDLKLIYEKTS